MVGPDQTDSKRPAGSKRAARIIIVVFTLLITFVVLLAAGVWYAVDEPERDFLAQLDEVKARADERGVAYTTSGLNALRVEGSAENKQAGLDLMTLNDRLEAVLIGVYRQNEASFDLELRKRTMAEAYAEDPLIREETENVLEAEAFYFPRDWSRGLRMGREVEEALSQVVLMLVALGEEAGQRQDPERLEERFRQALEINRKGATDPLQETAFTFAWNKETIVKDLGVALHNLQDLEAAANVARRLAPTFADLPEAEHYLKGHPTLAFMQVVTPHRELIEQSESPFGFNYRDTDDQDAFLSALLDLHLEYMDRLAEGPDALAAYEEELDAKYDNPIVWMVDRTAYPVYNSYWYFSETAWMFKRLEHAEQVVAGLADILAARAETGDYPEQAPSSLDSRLDYRRFSDGFIVGYDVDQDGYEFSFLTEPSEGLMPVKIWTRDLVLTVRTDKLDLSNMSEGGES